ncbi:hypothetical protein PROFUN_14382 [Planoprotostelium fungivorum]|uniref:Uncharacterized protein n=1 Tax=Planoprotostelium fungivorum TaxID=1890364 RepID=A0A2P6MW23_9EUKA|nr:hypothetical protein PROFUN_14382 [Planoprotostelium fungivorum]
MHILCQTSRTYQYLKASFSRWLRSEFKSFIGHLDKARNDTFWALAQNEVLVRNGYLRQHLNSCAAASEEMLGQTDAHVNRLLENGLFEFNHVTLISRSIKSVDQ